jgi:hypothetical protein
MSESSLLVETQLALNSQTMTSLGATGANDGATTTGAHTDEEAVGTLAAHDGRLVSTFHGGFPSLEKRAITAVQGLLVKPMIFSRCG